MEPAAAGANDAAGGGGGLNAGEVTGTAQELAAITRAMTAELIESEKIMQPAKTAKQVAGKGA